MSDSFRTLLYPLGFLASLLFAGRVFQQWLRSERKKKSHVTASFWIISLSANAIMTIHSFIQLQYPVCIIQALNGVIAWRNLQIMKGSSATWRTPIVWMAFLFVAITSIFALQGLWEGSSSWMRPPTMPWSNNQANNIGWLWHLLGVTGLTLFASRFWVQWIQAEKKQASILGMGFWWISLTGSLFSFAYFYRLHDMVNLVSYSTGLIPYMRNLFLLKKQQSPVIPQKNAVFVFAGEQSGDLLGGSLLKALKRKCPSLQLYGVGGYHMRQEGLECVLPMEHFQVMGISAVVKAFPRLFSAFHTIKKRILNDRPQAVILIDYQDFNMRLEKALRKKGYQGKLIHYVCPTVWAWRASRAKTLAKTVDLLLAIFPFETACFNTKKMAVKYVGHPLVSLVENHSYSLKWREACGISSEASLLAIFPGSRRHEIEMNLPLQLRAARVYLRDHPEMKIAVSIARPDLETHVRSFLPANCGVVSHEYRYELMKEAALAIATSGTVTLELALHSTPTIMTYPLNSLNYFVGKYLFRINLPHYCIVNIIGGKTIFPECIDKALSYERIVEALQSLDPLQCKQGCEEVKNLLKNDNSSEQAAIAISELMGNVT